MELGILNKKSKYKKGKLNFLHEVTGWFSFLAGLISLAILNISFILLSYLFLPTTFYVLSIMGIVCGLISIFTKGSKMNAWWGLGLNLFLFIFTFIMIIVSFNINPHP